MTINKVTLLGHLGRDPEVRSMQSGTQVANISIATSRNWKDKSSGEKREETEWHRVVFYDKLAEIVGKYLKKGSQVYVEGRLHYGEYEKDGVKRFTTDIVADELRMLGGPGERTDDEGKPAGAAQHKAAAKVEEDNIDF
jgi:single-strand DNA-binding protein